MKKKGLIIATIVMVLVLAVSLTTATYAWFTNEGSARVTNISFEVGASSDILIGVSATNTIVETPVPTSFYADGTTYTTATNSWTGTTNALGLAVDTGVDLTHMDKAVYSFSGTTATAYDPTSTSISNNVVASHGTQITTGIVTSDMTNIKKASGNGTAVSETSVEAALANGQDENYGDYLYVSFGAAAGKTDVIAYGCMVYIHPTDSKATLGLNAAIHVAYRTTYGGTWKEIDVYGTNTHATYKSTGASHMTAPTMPTTTISGHSITYKGSTYDTSRSDGDAYVFIPLQSTGASDSYISTSDITQVELVIYICGPDSDCITSATGVGSLISIEFLSINATQYAAQTA